MDSYNKTIPEQFLDATKTDNIFLFNLNENLTLQNKLREEAKTISKDLSEYLIGLFKEYCYKEGDIVEGGDRKKDKFGEYFYHKFEISRIDIGYGLGKIAMIKLYGYKLSKNGIPTKKEKHITNPRI